MNFDIRWLYAIIVFIIGAVIFSFSRKKEIFLIRILVFLMPFAIGFYYMVVSGKDDAVYACDVMLFFLYLYWFWETNGFKSQRIYYDKILLLYLALIIWALFPVGFVVSQSSLLFAVFTWIKCFFLFFYITNRIKSKEQLWIIIDVLLIALLFQGLVGSFQKISGRTLGLSFLGERQRVFLRASHGRARGTLGFPNQYAAYMIMIMPLAVTMFIYSKKGLKKLWYLVILIASSIGWITSLSRSGWLGMAGALVVIFFLMNKAAQVNLKAFFLLVFGILIISFLVFIFGEQVLSRVQNVGTQQYRMLMIRMSLDMTAANPIFGVGLWNYQFHSFGDFRYWHAVHNMFLRFAAETGIPGFLLFMAIIYNSFKNCIQSLRFRDRFLNYTALGIMGGQLAFIIAAMFNPQYQHYRHKFLFWFLIGLGIAVKRIGLHEKFIAYKKRKEKILNEKNREDVGYLDINQ
ncbi:MAG: O-antigen ligase family protein [bacterium]